MSRQSGFHTVFGGDISPSTITPFHVEKAFYDLCNHPRPPERLHYQFLALMDGLHLSGRKALALQWLAVYEAECLCE